jgi:hypothetical protein
LSVFVRDFAEADMPSLVDAVAEAEESAALLGGQAFVNGEATVEAARAALRRSSS